MKIAVGKIRLAATDLGNHLACRHLTNLELQVARGERSAPALEDPYLHIRRELGREHEAAYLKHLEEKRGLKVVRLPEKGNDEEIVAETLSLMKEGVDVIAQAALRDGLWFGRPDVLLRVGKPSGAWKWSYEVHDTKLSRETKAATILQLSLYSELVGLAQGGIPQFEPEFMRVITPTAGFEGERHRVADYAAYFRYVKRQLLRAAENRDKTYPELVEHCNICPWFRGCDQRRHQDDHLSLVAGIRRQQQQQLEEWNVETMAKLAALPIPLKERPRHGSKEAYEHIREQARVQVKGRTEKRLVCEPILPIAEGIGFCRLPETNRLDMFVDLEGDPFVGTQGQQYLFGFAVHDTNGEMVYQKRWALTAGEEKDAFEWLMDEIIRRWTEEPGMHVYHYTANEPGAFKRLMGQYATREEEVDRMLRAGVFVDLHRVVKQGIRASVEEYSLKKIEAFYGFQRETPLEKSRVAMLYIERHLELGWKGEGLKDEHREAMEGYNREDCESTAVLRDWLEAERTKLIAKGEVIVRPVPGDSEPSEELDEQQKRVAALFEELTSTLPKDAEGRDETQQAHWLLAQLLDWHRRESKAGSWRYYELLEMDDAELLEDNDAIAGLIWKGHIRREDGTEADRYEYPNQETKIRKGKEVYHKDRLVGTVCAFHPVARKVDIDQTQGAAGFHPSSIFARERYRKPAAQQGALYRFGCWVRDHGIGSPGNLRAGHDLLLKNDPRLLGGLTLKVSELEEFADEACRLIHAMNNSCLAVQGPPGSGKTTSAGQAIRELVAEGKRVGVTGPSHKVIRKLLKTITEEGAGTERRMHKCRPDELDEDAGEIVVTNTNPTALRALTRGTIDVLGGTSWLWSRPEFAQSLDYLFVDEAGQVSLADVLAMSQAAKNIVLLGDPQQLPLPQKGSHPQGAEASALGHILTERKSGKLTTMPVNKGLFIGKTHRLHPQICDYTSPLFYEGRLLPRDYTKRRILSGHEVFTRAGLWFVPVSHQGNRNSSAEEVEVVARIVATLRKPSVKWTNAKGKAFPLRRQDILIVAPYNAQVSDLSHRMPEENIGTVDKFQGQEAPVVIYSMTTSSPEDAPRGMEFLYSLNRLNVATSRAMTAVIVVGNPRLFEPECRSPRQMQLANALCLYREMATVVDPGSIQA
jgi:predicted RecB family nuclease